MKEIQMIFMEEQKVDDIWSNNKVTKILIADKLQHDLIPGHSGSRDAIKDNREYEYKHFKQESSNHSWTFNDYSDNTIKTLLEINMTLFLHI